MNRECKARKAKAGLLLIASPRFKNLSGPKRGTYGERKDKAVKEIKATMDFLDLVDPGIVYEREDAEKAIKLFFDRDVDFIYAEFLSWSEDFAWIRFLRDCPQMPIIFCNVAKPRMTFETTLDEDDFVDYLCAGTLVGSLEGSGSVKRIPREGVKTVLGTREEITERVRVFADAAKARAILRHSNLGLMANMNEAMWSTYIDNYDLFTKIGPEIHYLPYSDYGTEIDNLTDEEVKAYADELTSKYKMMDDVEYDKFIGCVKATLAIKKLAEKNDIDCYVYNDIDQATFRTAGCRAGFYPNWFNENVSVLVPEADIGAGLITYILKLLSGKHVNFIEPFHIEDDFGTFAGGHAGPNDHNDPAWQDNVIISRDVRFAKTSWKYAGAPFAWYRFSPGMKTVAGLYEENGKYKLVTFMAESLAEKDTPQSGKKHLLATYSHTIFKPVVPVKELWEKVLNIGVTQHYAIVDGDYRPQLKALAEMMGFDFYDIR
jgi:L-arabinose isomerase